MLQRIGYDRQFGGWPEKGKRAEGNRPSQEKLKVPYLFHGPLHYVSYHGNVFLLTEAQRSADGLSLNGRVPLRFDNVDAIRA